MGRRTNRIAYLLLWLCPMAAVAAGTGDSAAAAKTVPVPNAAQLKEAIANTPSTVIDLSGVAAAQSIDSVVDESVPKIRLSTPALKAGQVRIKPLSRDVDNATRTLVLQRIAQDPDKSLAGKATVVFNGAAEMLSADAQPLTLRALALADKPLRYNVDRRLYEGTLSVGVVEIDPSGKALQLSAPVVFEVLGVVARPKRISATATSPPFGTVAIEVENPGDSFSARVWSILDPTNEVILEMPVEKPQLLVSASPTRIQGWGLEKAKILVQATNLTGGQLTVQASNTLGVLDSNTLQIDQNAMAVATLRSASTGMATVTISGAPFESTSTEVEFVFPVRYILAALIGGLAGGLLRLGGKRRSGKRLAFDLIVAVIAGAIVFGLFVLGVNVTGFSLPAQAGEVLVFVVTALGGFGGARLFSVAAAKPGGGEAA